MNMLGTKLRLNIETKKYQQPKRYRNKRNCPLNRYQSPASPHSTDNKNPWYTRCFTAINRYYPACDLYLICTVLSQPSRHSYGKFMSGINLR